MLRCHFDAQVTLIVLKPYIVAWLVLFNEIIFQNQRFFGVGRNQGFDVFDAADQELNLRALVAAVEIGAYARAQVICLADVNDLPTLLSHQINAGA